jgi:hypothetical protein
MKMCEDSALDFTEKELAVASRQCTIIHFLLTRVLLMKNNMAVIPYPSYSSDGSPVTFFSFPD